MNLFQKGDFTLRSGRASPFKIECDALSEEDWEGLAAIANAMLKKRGIVFGYTDGVPKGGIPLAKAMSHYTTSDSDVVLICEDVWTTGGSIRRHIEKIYGDVSLPVLCAFARGPLLGNSHAILTFPPELGEV